MHRAHIYQIYYSEETRRALDPGFLPLDNVGQRPDWREYWPMRRFLREGTLDEGAGYGFLSPKFGQKTRLTGAQVQAFLAMLPPGLDVVTFSPFFDQAAFYVNVFEQAAMKHPGIGSALDGVLPLLAPGVEAGGLLMSSAQTVFCNYLVARPPFWRRWLEVCEVLFELTERGEGELARRLNADVPHEAEPVPAKVFVVERVASLLLATEPRWRVRGYNPMKLPIAPGPLSRYPTELVTLDALKRAAIESGFSEYVAAFQALRSALVQRIEAGR